jgi:hypothetical protein
MLKAKLLPELTADCTKIQLAGSWRRKSVMSNEVADGWFASLEIHTIVAALAGLNRNYFSEIGLSIRWLYLTQRSDKNNWANRGTYLGIVLLDHQK